MKKLILLLSMVMVLTMFSTAAMAAVFTLDQTQLLQLYETGEIPNHAGTILNGVTSVPGGAKYTGNIGAGIGLNPSLYGQGEISIGANYTGTPFGGVPGSQPTNVALGMGDMTGYDKYELCFENMNENAWKYRLLGNIGYTVLSETDYFIATPWIEIAAGSSNVLAMDFTNVQVWGGSYTGSWENLTTNPSFTGYDSHVTNMGFGIGANLPLGAGGNDWTFETIVRPVPEPSSMLLLGMGLIGLAGAAKRKFVA